MTTDGHGARDAGVSMDDAAEEAARRIEAAVRAEGYTDDACSPYYERGWKAGRDALREGER